MAQISRRTFLKVLGAGTAAATAYELRPNNSLLRAQTDEEKAASPSRHDWRSKRICI